jgi:hypothetical protein
VSVLKIGETARIGWMTYDGLRCVALCLHHWIGYDFLSVIGGVRLFTGLLVSSFHLIFIMVFCLLNFHFAAQALCLVRTPLSILTGVPH